MVRPNVNEKGAGGGSNTNAVVNSRERSAGPAITTEQYTRTRDSVVTGLTTLQSAIGELIHAYLAHTNVVLGGGPSTIGDTLAISNPLGLSSSAGGGGGVAGAGASVGVISGDVGKKKRARKERDPNAPKRPLTAYFLFAQRAREYVRRDLSVNNPDVKPGDISTESTRRWHAMKPEEQEKWKSLYRQYWQDYLRENKEYKAKFGIDVGADSDEGEENTDNDVPMTEEEAITHALLREQFQQYSTTSPTKGSKNKSKGRGGKATDAGENRGSVSRPDAAGAVSSSSPAPRRAIAKETPVPLPGTDAGGGAGTAEKRKKKSTGGNAAGESTTMPASADHDRDRDGAEEPKPKRTKRSKGGADDATGENAGEKERGGAKVSEGEAPAGTQEHAGGSGRKGRGKKKSEGGK